jgi:IPT/TIG domain
MRYRLWAVACAMTLVLLSAGTATAAPSVGVLSPTTIAAGSDPFVLVVDGDGFVQGSQVLWNGTTRTTTFVSSNRLTAAITRQDVDQATNATVQVRNGAEASTGVGFPVYNPTPYIYDLSPPHRVRGGGRFILTVTGSGFVMGSKVLWNGAERTTEYVDHGTLTADIPASDVASRTSATINVVSPPPTPYGALSPWAATFYATEPLPAITSLDPAQGTVGSGPTTLTIRGQNFVPGSRVYWDLCSPAVCVFDPNRTQYISSTELRISLTAQELSQAGRAYVHVENPNGWPEITDWRTWVIGQAPNTAPAPAANVQLLGRNDATGAFQAFNSAPHVWPGTTLVGRASFADAQGGPLTIEVNWRYNNGSYLDYRLLTKTVSGPGVWDFPLPNVGAGSFVARVRARDSDGLAGDWHYILPTDPDWTVVSELPPLVTSLAPSQVTAGASSQTLTVDGSGFTPGAVVQWNGESRPTTFVNSSRLTATIPGSDLATPGGATVRVRNAAFNAPAGAALSNASPFDVRAVGGPATPFPVSLSPPAISGAPQVGGVLACSTGTWANAPGAFTVAWLRDGAVVASGPSYTPVAADTGRTVSCRVTAVNAAGPGNAVSEGVLVSAAPAAPAATGIAPPVTRPSASVPRRLALLAPLKVVARRPFRLSLRFESPARKLLVRIQTKKGRRYVTIASRRVSGIAPVIKLALKKPGRQVIRVAWKAGRTTRVSKPVVVLVRRP